jgi:hypothetical protein
VDDSRAWAVRAVGGRDWSAGWRKWTPWPAIGCRRRRGVMRSGSIGEDLAWYHVKTDIDQVGFVLLGLLPSLVLCLFIWVQCGTTYMVRIHRSLLFDSNTTLSLTTRSLTNSCNLGVISLCFGWRIFMNLVQTVDYNPKCACQLPTWE